MISEEIPVDHVSITVIITAFNRKDFIRNAVNSVLKQTYQREKYEIIVVKNYLDEDIDSYLISAKVVAIKSNDSDTFGKCISLGIKHAHGEVICFLDDDDEFVPSKLSEVYSDFNEHNLSFLHNAMIPIDSDGNEVKGHWIWKAIMKDSVVISDPTQFSKFGTLFRMGADFGASSICINRDLARRLEPYLGQITSASDNIMFYLACTIQKPVEITVRRLTKYRIHTSNSSKPVSNSFHTYIKRFKKNAFEAYDSYKIIYSLVRNYPISRFVGYRLASYKFIYHCSNYEEKSFPNLSDLVHFILCDYYLRIPRAIVYGILYIPLKFSTRFRRFFLYFVWKMKYRV